VGAVVGQNDNRAVGIARDFVDARLSAQHRDNLFGVALHLELETV
jgi:hypothetical protein